MSLGSRAAAWAAGGLFLVAFAFVLGRGAAADDGEWKVVNPDRFPIVSRFAPLIEPLTAMPSTNRLGGQTINVQFRYEGGPFAFVVYNESPRKLPELSIAAATEQALSTNPMFKEGAFAPGDFGTADSPLGPFTYQMVHAQQAVAGEPMLSCAVFQRLMSAGMAALTGFFCADSSALTGETVTAFFATLGIRGIGMPQ